MPENEKENEKKGFIGNFIYRPVLSWVINIVIALVGAVSWNKLPIRELPKFSLPKMTVSTEYSGASPEIVESQVTVPLEESFAGIEGLDYIESSSTNGQSKIMLSFKSTVKIDSAAADVRERIMKTKDSLPQNLRDPNVTKSSSDAQDIIKVVITGLKHKPAELADLAQRYIKSAIEPIEGVATVNISGGGGGGDSGAFQIHALISPEKLKAYDLTLTELRESVSQQSFKSPLGDIIKNQHAITVTLNQSISSIEGYGNIFLKEYNGGIVRLKDVAEMKLMEDDPDSKVRFNNEKAILVSVIAQQDANPMEIAKSVNAKMVDIKRSLPKGVSVDIFTDRSVNISKSISSVYSALFEAIFFVFLTILIFLRSWKATFVPMVSIPVCILGGFAIIFAAGFSINTLTLLAMVLAIGLVVDDSIVVLENVYRYIEKGFSPFKAALLGIKEIQFAVIAMTFTLVSVYAPITLSSGIIGKLFTEFAVTLAGTVLISGIVALVLAPMLCANLLKKDESQYKWQEKLEVGLNYLDNKYKKVLEKAIKIKGKIVALSLAFGLSGFVGIQYLSKTLMPDVDMNLIVFDLQGPSGVTSDYVYKYFEKIQGTILKTPEVKNFLVSIQSKSGRDYAYVNLLEQEKRRTTCEQVLSKISKSIEPLQSGLSIRGHCSSGMLSGGGGGSKSLSFSIQSQRSYDEIEQTGRRVMSAVRSHPGINPNNIKSTRISPEKAYKVSIKKDKAAQMNIRMKNIGDMLSMVMRGQPPADRFEIEGKRYPMRLWVSDELRSNPNNIARFFARPFKTDDNTKRQPDLVSLKELLEIEEVKERPVVVRYEGMRSYSIELEVLPGYGVMEVFSDLEEVFDNVLPKGYKYSATGDVRQIKTEGSNISLIFFLALLFIFLIMAAQFESFLDPLIIMFSVPLALAGGVLVLFLIPDGALNIFTQIALITLIGLITKHGILIIDFANKLFEKERTKENLLKSIINASTIRLRPILMTTAAMVLGALPLALSSGAGYEVRRQIGWVIVSGMSFGTLFTIFLVPVVYLIVNNFKYFRKNSGL